MVVVACRIQSGGAAGEADLFGCPFQNYAWKCVPAASSSSPLHHPQRVLSPSLPPPSGILHTVATTFLSLSPPACLAPSPAAATTLRPRRPLLHGPGNDGLRSGSGQQQQEGEDARHRVPGPDGPAAQRAGEEVAQTQGPRRSHCEGRAQKGMM